MSLGSLVNKGLRKGMGALIYGVVVGIFLMVGRWMPPAPSWVLIMIGIAAQVIGSRTYLYLTTDQ